MNICEEAVAPLGDAALRVDFSLLANPAAADEANAHKGANQAAADEQPQHVSPRAAWRQVKDANLPGVVDVSFSYSTLLVQYDPLVLTYEQATQAVLEVLGQATAQETRGRTFAIPVCYGGEYGPDLDELCANKNMTHNEFVALHTSPDYLITTIGFMPGFAYLSGLDPRLAEPRKTEPRLRVEPGSVGIAVDQTGIYPLASPGGWQIVGRTPLDVFDPARNPSVLYQAGDTLRFVPISAEEFQTIRQAVELGEFDYESVVTA